MAKFDYGYWAGNALAAALVGLALTYFVSLLRSVMDIDMQEFKLYQ